MPAALVQRAVANVERQVSNHVWQVIAPGIMTALYAAPATRPMFKGPRLLPGAVVRRMVPIRRDPDYNQTEEDRRKALAPWDKSIFN